MHYQDFQVRQKVKRLTKKLYMTACLWNAKNWRDGRHSEYGIWHGSIRIVSIFQQPKRVKSILYTQKRNTISS